MQAMQQTSRRALLAASQRLPIILEPIDDSVLAAINDSLFPEADRVIPDIAIDGPEFARYA